MGSKGNRNLKKNNSGCFRETEKSIPQSPRIFFFFKAFKQQEKTKVSWTKGRFMNNPLGVRSELGFIFIHYIQKLKF